MCFNSGENFKTDIINSKYCLILMPRNGNSTTCLLVLINGILLPKLFWPAVRENCSSDPEKLLKFEAEGREFAKFVRSLEQFIQTVKFENNFW